MIYFQEINYPRDSDIHTLADFAELLCLTDLDGQMNKEYVSDHISDYNVGYKIMENILDDMHNHIKWRSDAFGEFYPFSLTDHGFDLVGSISEKNKTYLILLFCANLPFFTKTFSNELTQLFEKISKFAFRNIWPDPDKVDSFGKSLTSYTGSKCERLNAIFNQMGHVSNFKDDSHRVLDSGDGGIDLVSWYPLDKYQKTHTFSALAQCACSRKQWVKKQGEISQKVFQSFVQVTNPWLEILFTPISFRNNNGQWCIPADVHSGIFFDRLRIINSLDKNFDYIKFNIPDSYDDIFNYKRDTTS